METLESVNSGDAPFPTVGQWIGDTEWEENDYGTVVYAEYPTYVVEWVVDKTTTTERVRY
jgi:hypothetical protein